MARSARIVVPDIPHHVTQRGNRNQTVFFSDRDRLEYLQLIKKYAQKTGTRIWAYCLMTNHVHFIAVPQEEGGLAHCFSEVHQRYTRYINFREKWRGYLWQGRFSSYPLDERHLYAAVRYVERNPVRAGMVPNAWAYPWSSARFHVQGTRDILAENCFLKERIPDWKVYLTQQDETQDLLRKHERTGRPLGENGFINDIETKTGRVIAKHKPGPKLGSKNKLSIVSP